MTAPTEKIKEIEKPKKCGWGGHRPNSGRRPGARNRKFLRMERAVLEAEELLGPMPLNITPVQVMLISMRLHVQLGNWPVAVELAKAVAPYVHEKLTAIVPVPDVKRQTMTTEELKAELIAMCEIVGDAPPP
jgi:hypothetical protein